MLVVCCEVLYGSTTFVWNKNLVAVSLFYIMLAFFRAF